MTYYKYVERDATSQVNWADVSKKFSDEISRIGGERDKKRAEIDKATDELVEKINAAPKGQHQNANSFTASLVDQTTADTLRMNKLLKSGDIKPSEYMNYIENQKSSITGLYDMVTDYQTVYTDKMERARTDQSLSGEVDGMAVVEGFGNFTNITPVIDMYGNVTMVDNVTGLTLSVAEQRAITNQYFDAYDIDSVLDEEAKQLGRYVVSVMDGTVKTREDVMQEEGYSTELGALVEAALEGHLAVSTVLDKKLAGYSSSFFPSQADENDILYIPDPRQPGSGAQIPLVEVVEQVAAMGPEERRDLFGEDVDVDRLIEIARAQRKAAEDWTRGDLQNRFDMIETADTTVTPYPRGLTDAERKRQLGVSTTQDGVDNLQAIFTARDADTLEAALSYFEAKNPGVDLEVVESDDGVRQLAILRSGEEETRYVTIGSNLADYNKFVEAAGPYVITNTEYLSEVLKRTPLGENAMAGTQLGGVRAGRVVEDLLTEEIELAGQKVPFGSIVLKGAAEGAAVFDSSKDTQANTDYSKLMKGLAQLGDAVANLSVTPLSTDEVDGVSGVEMPALKIFDETKMAYPVYLYQGKSESGRIMSVLDMIYSTQGVVDMAALTELLGDNSRTITNAYNNLSGAEEADVVAEEADVVIAPGDTVPVFDPNEY